MLLFQKINQEILEKKLILEVIVPIQEYLNVMYNRECWKIVSKFSKKMYWTSFLYFKNETCEEKIKKYRNF